MAVTVAELHGLPPVAAAAVGADGPPLDPQLDSVIEGRHRQSEADPVDENGDALEFGEKLSVSLTPAGTADAQDLAPSMDPVDIAANGESATLDLTVRENEEVNPETLVLDAEVAGERAYGRKTRATCRWPSMTPPGGSSRRGRKTTFAPPSPPPWPPPWATTA